MTWLACLFARLFTARSDCEHAWVDVKLRETERGDKAFSTWYERHRPYTMTECVRCRIRKDRVNGGWGEWIEYHRMYGY